MYRVPNHLKFIDVEGVMQKDIDSLKLLDVNKVASLLGLGVRTVWRWVASGKLPQPVIREGRIVRWRLKDLLEWLDEQADQNARGGR